MPPNNAMSLWGNEKTMNLNTLVLTNIQSSPYFKVKLFELKTYHEVIDEIYYKVGHLEPWEKGSRKTAGQTGMCGGVRGVGAGGIVSSAYCLLYKLFTLKLTKKQVIGLINHPDSPYIRGLGFMYIRYTQPPADLWAWFDEYLDDEEEIDVKAGGGHVMTIGEMLRQWLVKLEWYATLFPRIPVPIQKDLALKLKDRPFHYGGHQDEEEDQYDNQQDRRRGFQDNSYGNNSYGRDGRDDSYRGNGSSYKDDSRDNYYRNGEYNRDRDNSRQDFGRDRDTSRQDFGRDRDTSRQDFSRDKDSSRREYSRDRDTRDRDTSRRDYGDRDTARSTDPRRDRGRSPATQRQRSPYERSSLSRRSPPRYTNSFERELARERERQQREQGRDKHRSRSRSPRDRADKRSGSAERRDRRSSSKDRKDRRSPVRKEKRSRSRERKERKEHKEKRRSRSQERHSSHKHKKDKRRDEDRREAKAHKHRHRD